jgi:hypothetical protein
MKTHSCLSRGLVCYATAIISLASIGVGLLGKDTVPQPKKRDAKAVAKMVDDIASRNKPPREVQTRLGPRPLFPKDYDWREQSRVKVALRKLKADTTIEVWDQMLRKGGDQRYSLTYINKGDCPENLWVGYFCGSFAYLRLAGVFEQHLPPDPHNDSRAVYLDLRIGDLVEWRKERKDKAFYELQIEVCQRALKALRKVKDISRDKKDAACKKIEAEIKKLRKTKRPIYLKTNRLGLDTYSVEDAKRFRKLYEEKIEKKR